jgi:hypothetical protein
VLWHTGIGRLRELPTEWVNALSPRSWTYERFQVAAGIDPEPPSAPETGCKSRDRTPLTGLPFHYAPEPTC